MVSVPKAKTALVAIWFRQTKRISYYFYLSSFPCHPHFRNIEAEMNIRISQQLEPGQSTTRNESLFRWSDSLCRGSKTFRPARFYFHKNERIPLAAYQVHFTAFWGAVVAIEYFEADAAQMTGRYPLPSPPQGVAGIREGRAAPDEPGESFDDGLDKAHGRAAYQDVRLFHSLCVGKNCNRGRASPSPP